VVTHLICVREVPDWNVGLATSSPADRFVVFFSLSRNMLKYYLDEATTASYQFTGHPTTVAVGCNLRY